MCSSDLGKNDAKGLEILAKELEKIENAKEDQQAQKRDIQKTFHGDFIVLIIWNRLSDGRTEVPVNQ